MEAWSNRKSESSTRRSPKTPKSGLALTPQNRDPTEIGGGQGTRASHRSGSRDRWQSGRARIVTFYLAATRQHWFRWADDRSAGLDARPRFRVLLKPSCPNVSPPPASPKASKAEGHHHTVKASRRGGRQGAPPASPVVKSPRFRLGLGVMPARTPPTGVLRGFNGRFGGILCQRAPR